MQKIIENTTETLQPELVKNIQNKKIHPHSNDDEEKPCWYLSACMYNEWCLCKMIKRIFEKNFKKKANKDSNCHRPPTRLHKNSEADSF